MMQRVRKQTAIKMAYFNQQNKKHINYFKTLKEVQWTEVNCIDSKIKRSRFKAGNPGKLV